MQRLGVHPRRVDDGRCRRGIGGAYRTAQRGRVLRRIVLRPEMHLGNRHLLRRADAAIRALPTRRSEEHTSELQSLMRISYAVFCLKKKIQKTWPTPNQHTT